MANVPAGPPVGSATDRRLRQDFGGEGRQGQEISSGLECGIGDGETVRKSRSRTPERRARALMGACILLMVFSSDQIDASTWTVHEIW
jgi:hypothetical protein